MIIPPLPIIPPRVRGIPVHVDILQRRVATARGVWPFKRIVVGENFFYLTQKQQMAFLLHEVGHCKKMHMEKRLLSLPWLLIDPERNIAQAKEQEHEADEFAAREGYGVELLSGLKKFTGESGVFYPTLEARAKRINALTGEHHGG